MSSTDRLFKLAERFERKFLLKKAEELGDTSMINIRPLINKMLTGREGGGQAPEPPPSTCLKGKILAIINKGVGTGDIAVGEKFYFTAKKIGNNWVVSEAHTDVKGSLSKNSNISAAIQLFHGAAKAAVQAELNRVKSNLGDADTITNMVTFVDGFNFTLD